MAAALRKCLLQINKQNRLLFREIHYHKPKLNKALTVTLFGCTAATAVTFYFMSKRRLSGFYLSVVSAKSKDAQEAPKTDTRPMASHRERRFLNFASMELDGNVYMTPQDFLESVTQENPRPRIGRVHLTEKDVDGLLKNIPARRKSSHKFFRNMHNNGLISYTEYLFLLCVLTKAQSGFEIAFNMFDVDGNQRVDKKEFLVLERIILRHKVRRPGSTYEEVEVDSHLSSIDTTLLVHFFGRKGTDVLTYDDFSRFMENLQTEVLEIEFNEFARGMSTITEEDFARILLRYTTLNAEDYRDYLSRLHKRLPEYKGISFVDFKDFCQFLNSLVDFTVALRMYTFADQPISQDEFKRAVKVCTGKDLNPHVINTVFQLFDIDGDGSLSADEFITIMKDRIQRGFRTHLVHQNYWESWKNCVKTEMRKT